MDRTAGAPAFAGVDTHKDTHTLALLDGLRRPIGTWKFPTGPEGYALLEEAIGAEELESRLAAWRANRPAPTYTRGYAKLYVDHVLQADEGCDFDFLRGRTS